MTLDASAPAAARFPVISLEASAPSPAGLPLLARLSPHALLPTDAGRRAAANGALAAAATLSLSSVALGAWQNRRGARGAAAVTGGVASLLALALVRSQFARWFAESPDYAVESHAVGLEVRRYEAQVAAETIVDNLAWRASLNEGFNRLAGYIFGGNAGHEHLAMTAPVTCAHGASGGVVVSFQIPRGRPVETLPAPFDPRVILRPQPAARVAVLRFTGPFVEATVRKRENDLLASVQAAGLSPRGRPHFAGYDAPYVLPWLRRNEVWVEISEA